MGQDDYENDDQDENSEEIGCPYCDAEETCEHLLLTVDTTFREAVNGPLHRWFNGRWSDILEAHQDDDNFDEREPFDELQELVDSAADASIDGEFEGGPGQSSSLRHFYCSSAKRVVAAVQRLAPA